MSIEQRKQIESIATILMKIALAISAFMITSVFYEVKNDINTIKTDITNVRERVSRMEGQLNSKP